jgi:hypothetical protein
VSSSVSDVISIKGDTSGTTELFFDNIGGAGAVIPSGDAVGILVVQVSGKSEGMFTLGAPVLAGDYEYSLHKANNGNWYLQSSMKTSIGGTIWFDTNSNGVFDDGEEVVAEGITVELLDEFGNVLQHTVLDASGQYRFYTNGDQKYKLHFVLSEELIQEGYMFPEAGLVNSDGYTGWLEPEKGSNDVAWGIGIACPCAGIRTDTGDSMHMIMLGFLFGLTIFSGVYAVRREEEIGV